MRRSLVRLLAVALMFGSLPLLAGCDPTGETVPIALIDNNDGTAEVLTPVCAGDAPVNIEVSENPLAARGGDLAFKPSGNHTSHEDGVFAWTLSPALAVTGSPPGWDRVDVKPFSASPAAASEFGSVWVDTTHTGAVISPGELGIPSSGAWLVGVDADGFPAKPRDITATSARYAVKSWCATRNSVTPQ